MNNLNENTSAIEDFFGPVIYAYTRAMAIKDGNLVDVTEIAQEAGFSVPVALTRAVWEKHVAWDQDDNKRHQTYQDETGRLWDVVYMARCGCVGANKGESQETLYELYCVPRHGRGKLPRRTVLKMHIGPGDEGEPVITIMLPNES